MSSLSENSVVEFRYKILKTLDELKELMAKWCGADQKNAILEELKFIPYTGQSLLYNKPTLIASRLRNVNY